MVTPPPPQGKEVYKRSEAEDTSSLPLSIFIKKTLQLQKEIVTLQREKTGNMTSVTIQMEESVSANLRKMADEIGMGIDKYIIYLLSKAAHSEISDVDTIVKSMQLRPGNVVPVDENGKGAIAEYKYLA